MKNNVYPIASAHRGKTWDRLPRINVGIAPLKWYQRLLDWAWRLTK